MSGPHTLLLASAGTGKTFRLATHFAGLLAAGCDPSQVLATTFTRKAAGEILDRVLQRLVEASAPDEKGASARQQLGDAVRRIDDAFVDPTRERCLERLAALVRSIQRFQVRTLDAFFVQVAKLFAYELSLAPEWRILDDVEDDELRAEVLATLVEGLGADERVALLRGIARAGAPTASHSELLGAIDRGLALHRETLPGDGAAAWDRVDPPIAPPADTLDAARRTLLDFDVPATKAGKPNKNWEKVKDAAGAALEAGLEGDWAEWWALGLVGKVQDGAADYYRADIPDDVREAVLVVSSRARADELAEVLAENRETGKLLELYTGAERRVRDGAGAYRFDDFPRALSRGPSGAYDAESLATWRGDLGFRLDARVQHLLLDEFQDTAPLQWRLLLPVASEIIDTFDGSRTFFCVGDVKQSIYGWREAEPRLLGEMHARHPVLEPEEMTESWRSSEVVLDTVNRLFAGLAERAMFAGEDDATLHDAAARWAAGFQPHTRAVAAGACPGAALVLEAEAADHHQRAVACIDLAAERVAALVREAPEAKIAVLVRGKKHVPRLLFLLRREGIEASDEGGNPLVDAPVVAQALALLHLADHPEDGVARLAVSGSPFAEAYGLAEHRADTDAAGVAARAASRRLRRELVEEGLGGLLERLASDVLDARETSDWDRTRFAQLVDLALAHEERASLRPAEFAEVVRRTRVEAPSAARVKVMTIHASKGLEFDAVVLPDLTGALVDSRLEVLSQRADADDPLSPVEVLSRAPKKAVMRGHAELERMRADAEARRLVDELSVLYVAVTRAKHRVELIVPSPSQSGVDVTKARLAELVRDALLDTPAQAPDDERVLWRHPDGVEAWFVPEDAAAAEPRPRRRLRLAPGDKPRTESRRSPSAADVRRPDAASLLAAPDRRARALGTLVHALFEDVEWIEDEERDDDALLARCLAVDPDESLGREAVARFRRALGSETVCAALSRASVPGGLTASVHNERAFDVELEGGDAGERWGGAIDRLVLLRRDGVLEGAVILDFKTDAAPDDEALQERHAAQLAAYRRVVVEMTGLEPEAVESRALAV